MKRLTGFSITAVLLTSLAAGLSSCDRDVTVEPGDSGPARATTLPASSSTSTTDSTLPLLPPASITIDPVTGDQTTTAPATTTKPKVPATTAAPATTTKPKVPATTAAPTTQAPNPPADTGALFLQVFSDLQRSQQAFYVSGDLIAWDTAVGKTKAKYSSAGVKIVWDGGEMGALFRVTISGMTECRTEDLSGTDPILVPTAC